MENTPSHSLAAFQGKEIRKTWHNEEWWFVIEDIVFVLTNSQDPKQYINKMRQRDEQLSQGWVQIVHTLPIETMGGSQKLNCVSTKGAFRIIQSIPSPKVEPFKLWLAQVGYERMQEMADPAKSLDRARKYWSDLKVKLTEEGFEVSEKIGQLKLKASQLQIVTG